MSSSLSITDEIPGHYLHLILTIYVTNMDKVEDHDGMGASLDLTGLSHYTGNNVWKHGPKGKDSAMTS